jgi:hypothetical protein
MFERERLVETVGQREARFVDPSGMRAAEATARVRLGQGSCHHHGLCVAGKSTVSRTAPKLRGVCSCCEQVLDLLCTTTGVSVSFPFDGPDGHETFVRRGAPLSRRIERLREALNEIEDIDVREDTLEHQLGALDAAGRQEYVKLLACEAYENFEQLNYLLSHLSAATPGTRFERELSAASKDLYELLEALSMTGSPEEVWGPEDRPN